MCYDAEHATAEAERLGTYSLADFVPQRSQTALRQLVVRSPSVLPMWLKHSVYLLVYRTIISASLAEAHRHWLPISALIQSSGKPCRQALITSCIRTANPFYPGKARAIWIVMVLARVFVRHFVVSPGRLKLMLVFFSLKSTVLDGMRTTNKTWGPGDRHWALNRISLATHGYTVGPGLVWYFLHLGPTGS